MKLLITDLNLGKGEADVIALASQTGLTRGNSSRRLPGLPKLLSEGGTSNPEAIEEFGLEAIARHFQGRPGVTGKEFSPGT